MTLNDKIKLCGQMTKLVESEVPERCLMRHFLDGNEPEGIPAAPQAEEPRHGADLGAHGNPALEVDVLVQADCLDYMATLPDGCVDLILTDPPYGISFHSHMTDHQRPIENDGFEEWQSMLDPMLAHFTRLLTPTGVCLAFCGGGGRMPVTAIFTLEAVKHMNLIQTLVWRKSVGLGWKYRPAYENILVLSKSRDGYAFYDTSSACANLIEGINKYIPQEGEHPTQKPVKLMDRLLAIHSKPGDLVLDPFAGSGSTLVACQNSGRRYIGVEMDAAYCELARKRLLQKTLF
jgi:site-specific DNA-methyltransferase (adenine-specific)